MFPSLFLFRAKSGESRYWPRQKQPAGQFRVNRIQEVRGSNPFGSTILPKAGLRVGGVP